MGAPPPASQGYRCFDEIILSVFRITLQMISAACDGWTIERNQKSAIHHVLTRRADVRV
jgi:hypothetical protein